MSIARRPTPQLPPIWATLVLGVLLHAALRMPVLDTLASVAGTAALALAVRRMLLRLDVPDANRAAALLFILPSSLIDAGLFGQLCGVACVMALAAAFDKRHAVMLMWCGLALGFSAQALLIAPFFLALLVQRRVPFRLWPIAPAIAIATMLPAWILGLPVSGLSLHTVGTFDALSGNAPNIWAIVQALPVIGALPLLGLAIAASIGATAAYIAWFASRTLPRASLLAAALLAPLLLAGLLPGMHERDFLLASVLSLVLAAVIRDKASLRVFLLVQTGSVLALLGTLSGIPGYAAIGAIAMIAATIQLARPLIQPAANDNPLIPPFPFWYASPNEHG